MKNFQIIERYFSLKESERSIIRSALTDDNASRQFAMLRMYFPDIRPNDIPELSRFAA